MDYEWDEHELDLRIEAVIREVVPEPTPPPKPKPLSFWGAWKTVDEVDNIGWGFVLGVLLIGGCALSFLSPSETHTPSEVAQVRILGHMLLGLSVGGVFVLPIRVVWLMRKSRRALPNHTIKIVPPSQDEIQRRVLAKMKTVMEESKSEVEGPESSVEKKASEYRQSINEAKTVKEHFDKWVEEFDDPEARELARQAKIVLESLQAKLDAFIGEQQRFLEFFREVETVIPREQNRIVHDEFERRLRKLQGKASTAQEESQEVLLRVLRPLFEKLIPLEAALQRLKLQAATQIEGPGSISRLITTAEEVEKRPVKSAILDIRRKLKA